jgi:thiopeptide-type bacteriocin biosynthesis protein
MATEWLCVQLYPGDWTSLDAAIKDVVRPARVEAFALGVDRWFFIRYIDLSGPHLRLRVRGETDAINAVYQRWRLSLRRQMAGDLSVRSGDVRDVLVVPYEPEFEKYGGPAGVEIAERAFDVSSDAVLDLLDLCAAPGPRLAIATLVMRRLAGCVPDVDPARFWRYHDNFWTLPGARTPPAALAPDTDRTLHELEGDLGRRVQIVSLVNRLADSTTAAISDALALDVNLTPEHLLLHHLHMTVNRLGILPNQEASLGRRIALTGRQIRVA